MSYSPAVKICGVTNSRDYHNAVALGARYIGFIFYPRSPRYINPRTAAELVRSGPKRDHRLVGVFVNEDISVVRGVYRQVGLDIVQLHGDEDPGYVERLRLPCWKALRMKDCAALEQIPRFHQCEAVLLDTYREGVYGGVGEGFNPEWAKLALEYNRPVAAAGGISASNLHQYTGSPFFALDVGSSLEIKPGIKSTHRLAEFFCAYRAVFPDSILLGGEYES